MKTKATLLGQLRVIQALGNDMGKDSTKRALALEAIAGPADGEQTNRLVSLAIAMLEARGER